MLKQRLNYCSKRILLTCLLFLVVCLNTYANHNNQVDTNSKEYQDYIKFLLGRNTSFDKIKHALDSGSPLDGLSRLYPAPPLIEIKNFLNQEQNPLYANQLLDLVLRSQLSFLGQNAIDLNLLVATLIKKYHADPAKIRSFDLLPSLTLSKFLLDHGLSPNQFLNLVLFAEANTQDVLIKKTQQLNQLIALAAKYRADFTEFPVLKTTFALKHKLLSFDQTTLLENMVFFLKKYPQVLDTKIAARMTNNQGNCHGLTTLWLYSKWLQFNQPSQQHWLEHALINLAAIKQVTTLSQQQITNLKKFIEKIDFLQRPRNYIEGMANGDLEVHKIANRLTADGKILNEQYKIAATFTALEPLIAVLKEIVIDNVMIFGIYPAQVNHSLGIFKHGANYYFYDPNNIFGEAKFQSIEQLAQAIMYAQNILHYNNTLRVGFVICDFNRDKLKYFATKPPEVILAKAFKVNSAKISPNILADSAYAAIATKDAESLQFWLKQGLEPDQVNLQEGRTLLDMATTANAPTIVKMLLKYPDVDPNQIIIGETLPNSQGSKIKGGTCLHTAAKKGYFAVVETLLNDGRVKREQQDAAGKTALDYAIMMHRDKTVAILSKSRNWWQQTLFFITSKLVLFYPSLICARRA